MATCRWHPEVNLGLYGDGNCPKCADTIAEIKAVADNRVVESTRESCSCDNPNHGQCEWCRKQKDRAPRKPHFFVRYVTIPPNSSGAEMLEKALNYVEDKEGQVIGVTGAGPCGVFLIYRSYINA